MPKPTFYRSIEEFEREEIRPNFRVGYSLADLESEANIHKYGPQEEFEADEPKELNFDF